MAIYKHELGMRAFFGAGCSFAALSLCLSAPALAQSQGTPSTPPAAQEPDRGLDDIVVTARRVSENLQDVPIAITAFSGDQLASKNVLQVADIAQFTPGFSIQPSARNATAITLSIRGQAQNDVLATVEPSIGTYVDEVYWARAYGLNAGLVDIANVQVLKGPQGTLFGRNTSGGALLINTADPDFDGISGRVSGTYGRFNERSGEAVLNVPLGQVLALRGAFKISKRDGWAREVALYNAAGVRDNTNNPSSTFQPTGRKLNDRDELQGRVKALVNISEATRLLLSGEWYHYESDGPARQTLYKVQLNQADDNVAVITPINRYIDYFTSHPNAVGGDGHDCIAARTPSSGANCASSLVDAFDPSAVTKTQTYNAKLTSDTTFGQVKLIGSYRHVESHNLLDLDGSSLLIHSTQADIDLKQYSAEAQATGKAFGDFLDFAAGITYFRETGLDRTYSFSNSGGNPTATVSRQNGVIENDSFGIYGQTTAHVTSRLSLTGGLRYSIDDKRLDLGSAVLTRSGAPVVCFVGGTVASGCVVQRAFTSKALSWTASADYQLNDGILAYAKASRGYRAGGHNLGALNAAQFVPFAPEFVYEQELGLKTELFDRRVRLNISAYRNLLKGAQRTAILTTNGTSNTLVANAAEARNLGAEIDLQIRPVTGLTLSASGAINDAKYTAFADASGDRRNERFVYVPKYQFSVSGEYATDLTAGISGQLNVDYSWTDDQASNECVGSGGTLCYTGGTDITGATRDQINAAIVKATTIPAAGILNARVTFGINDDAYTIAFWGRNVTDNRGVTQALRVPAPFRNYVSGLRRDPASYGVTVAAKF